jgi:hypothetical protein
MDRILTVVEFAPGRRVVANLSPQVAAGSAIAMDPQLLADVAQKVFQFRQDVRVVLILARQGAYRPGDWQALNRTIAAAGGMLRDFGTTFVT